MNGLEPDRAVVDELISAQAKTEAEVERLKAMGGVELDVQGKPETPVTLGDIGVVNRRTARRAGFRNPKRTRAMAVPNRRRKARKRR